MQQTLVLIKPDAVEKEAWLSIINTYQVNALYVEKTRIMAPMPFRLAHQLYAEHRDKDFYFDLLAHMTSGTTIALMVSGADAVATVRELNGATKPEEADIKSIRSRYGTKGVGPANAVHGSATEADARRELEIIFGQ